MVENPMDLSGLGNSLTEGRCEYPIAVPRRPRWAHRVRFMRFADGLFGFGED